MKVLVTGATGFIGRNLTQKLADSGIIVHALYRDISKTEDLHHENIRWVYGMLTDRESIREAMKGCTQVYHLAAFASLLTGDPGIVYKQNVQGTVNMLEAARDLNIQKFVFTSTAGVIGPSEKDPLDETAPYPQNMFTHYNRSKALAEQKVIDFVKEGLDAVIVNPTRVFGPGVMSTSNAARMLSQYINGRWHIRPGNGQGVGNYVFVDDVSKGMILAMGKGVRGERYLLGGENVSFNEWINIVNRINGKKPLLVSIPLPVIVALSYVLLGVARITGWAPPFTPDVVRRYQYDWYISIQKAKKDLGYKPISFEEGMKITIKWLNQ